MTEEEKKTARSFFDYSGCSDFTCGRGSCKFECRDSEIRHEHGGDANGRLGGTRHWSSTKSYIWPSTDYCIDVDTVGFDSSMAGDQHVTEDWSLVAEGNPDELPDNIKDIINAK